MRRGTPDLAYSIDNNYNFGSAPQMLNLKRTTTDVHIKIGT